jgi:hypothetical protein
VNTRLTVVLSCMLLVVATACSLTSLIPGGGSSGTVSELWQDVPPLDGATRESIEIPLPVKLALQAMLQGKLEFIVFTTTKTPQEVREFYTNERMRAEGWDVDNSPGCEVGQTESKSGMENMCLFQKKQGAQTVGLVVLMVPDEKTKKTQLFYARVLAEGTPAPGAPTTETPAD